MVATEKNSPGVNIGNVTGGIKNSNIAGGDITITEIKSGRRKDYQCFREG